MRIDYMFDSVALCATLAQTREIFQIVSLVITCISFAISIAYTVYKWYHKAKEDGKITGEDIKELIDDIKQVKK